MSAGASLAGAPAPHRYGCNNIPRPGPDSSYTAQAGWREYEERGEIVRVPVWKKTFYAFTIECKYDKTATDKACAGCVHGEQRP